MRLRVRALGLAMGIAGGLYIFLATLWLIWFREGANISALTNLYPGYATTYLGAIVGLLWGVFDGFIVGAVIAWLYNLFHKALYKAEASK